MATSNEKQISNRAALFAVVTAFVVGMIGSLAVRPVHAPAAATDTPDASNRVARISWRLPVVFQTTMPVLGDNPVYLANTIKAASGGDIDLQIFEPGEIVPAFSITDAVRDGKVSAGYTWLGYDQGKIPASPLISAVPFGMEPWEYSAWWYEGGGRQLTEKLYERYNIRPIYCGNDRPRNCRVVSPANRLFGRRQRLEDPLRRTGRASYRTTRRQCHHAARRRNFSGVGKRRH